MVRSLSWECCSAILISRLNTKNLSQFLIVPALQQFKTIIFSVIFILGIYLGGVPSYSSDIQVLRESPGRYYLSFLKPQAPFQYKFFFLSWAGELVVTAVSHLPVLNRFFEIPFDQYLGRVSFGLYLVHSPILQIRWRTHLCYYWMDQSIAI
jgi:peptidoglycan/LPS O-acetylase OafA/YrhL